MAIRIPIITDYYDKGVKTAERSFAGLAKTALIAGAAFKVVGGFIMDATKAAMEDQAGQALLARQLEATTGATKGQIAAIEDAITQMSLYAAVADDEIRPALGNLVRATGDAKKAQDLLKTSLDIAAQTGKPLEAVSLALSKAYLGNVGALTKLGIPIDEATKKSKDFDRVLGDLNGTFGGAAEQYGKTAEGRFKTMTIQIDELKETIGAELIPIILDIANVGIPAIEKVVLAFGALKEGIKGNKSEAGGLLGAFQTLVSWNYKPFREVFTRLGWINKDNKKTVDELSSSYGQIVGLGPKLYQQLNYNFEDLDEKTGKANTTAQKLAKTLREAFKTAREEGAKAVEELVKVRDAFSKTISDAVTQGINFGTLGNQMISAGETLAGLIAQGIEQSDPAFQKAAAEAGKSFMTRLTETVGKAKVFADRLQQLLRAGLSQEALSQVAQAGADAGTVIADELLAGGAATIGQANDLVAAAQKAAIETGTLAGATYYDEGIVLAQQLTQGITDVISKYKIKLKSPGLTEKQLNRLRNRFAIDVDFVMSQVPALGQGGIVASPTLALIGEAGPEAVVPLDKMGQMGNVTINVNGGDPQAVVDALRRYMYQNGTIPIRVSG